MRPSRELEQRVTDGRLGALALHAAHALTGGIPLTVDGEVVGAVGASGETTDTDEMVALAGAAAGFSTREDHEVTQVGARMVGRAAFGPAGCWWTPRATRSTPAAASSRARSSTTGDVLATPNGVPHQLTDVSDPFLYLVVKVGT